MDQSRVNYFLQRTSPWVLGWVSLFAILLCFQGALIYFAYHSEPDLVDSNYYEKGQSFIARQNARARTGFEVTLTPIENVVVGVPKDIQVQVHGQGLPKQVTLYVYRPDSQQADFQQALARKSDGTYAGSVRFPKPGVWDIVAAVIANGSEITQAQRLNVGPRS